jgi:hypothetical protein
MDRKEFIKTLGLGIGLALTSQTAIGKGISPKAATPQSKPKIKDGKGKVLNVIGDIQTHKLL